MAQKRKISVTLDEDLVTALEVDDETLSAQVNAAVRVEVERRVRQQLLQRWLDELAEAEGPVDEASVAGFEDMLA